MIRILFIGMNNSGRSQIAEGLINHHLHGRAIAFSAGVNPTKINPLAAEVMNEIGINIYEQTVNSIEDFRDQDFDYIITLCDSARESCPVFWATGEAVYRHFNHENPENIKGGKEMVKKNLRNLRDQLEEDLLEFFDSEFKKPGTLAPSGISL